MKPPYYFRLSVFILWASLNISCTSSDNMVTDDSNTIKSAVAAS